MHTNIPEKVFEVVKLMTCLIYIQIGGQSENYWKGKIEPIKKIKNKGDSIMNMICFLSNENLKNLQDLIFIYDQDVYNFMSDKGYFSDLPY